MQSEREVTAQRRLAQGALALGLLVVGVQAVQALRCSGALSALDAAPGLALLGGGLLRLVRALAVLALGEVAVGAALALAGLRLLRQRRGLDAVLACAYGLQLLVFVVPLFFEGGASPSRGGLQLSGEELAEAARVGFGAALTGRVLGLLTLPVVLLGHRLRRVSH